MKSISKTILSFFSLLILNGCDVTTYSKSSEISERKKTWIKRIQSGKNGTIEKIFDEILTVDIVEESNDLQLRIVALKGQFNRTVQNRNDKKMRSEDADIEQDRITTTLIKIIMDEL